MLDPDKYFSLRSFLIAALLLYQIFVPNFVRSQISATSLNPADGATGVKKGKILRIYFNHNWYASTTPTTKYVTIYRAENGVVFDTMVIPTAVGGTGSNEMQMYDKPYFTTGSYYVHIAGGIIKSSTDSTLYGGISDSTTWNFTVDASGPVVTSLSPLDGATDATPWTDLTMTFNENIYPYNGYIYLKKSSDNNVVQSFMIAASSIGSLSSAVTISGNQITINPTDSLMVNTSYYVTVNAAAIKDAAANYYAGINGSTTWNFTIGNQWWCAWTCSDNFNIPDPIFTPLDNATGVSLTSNLTMLFDAELLQIGEPLSTIRIKRTSNDSTVETIFMNSPKITIENGDFMGDASKDTRITINPAATLSVNNGYYIDIGCDALKNALLYEFGIDTSTMSGKTVWSFTTVADATAPTISSYSPADNATGVSISANLVMNFDEDVQKGTGNILIKRSSNDATVQTVDVTDGIVTVSGSQVTVNPSDFSPSNGYYINLASGVIADLAGNAYAGIANTTTWNFTTGATGYPILQTSYPPPADTIYSRNNIRIEFDRPVNLNPGANTMSCKTGSYAGPTIFTVPLTGAATTVDSAIIKVPPLPPGLLPGTTIFCQFSGVVLPAQADASTNPGNFQFQIKLDPAPIIAPGF